MRGIDISIHNNDAYSHNNRVLPWNKLKNAGIDFVIIRTGAGLSIEDTDFSQNVDNAHREAIKVGAYHYSYALTTDAIQREAQFCKQILQKSGKFLELPIFLDMEDADNYKRRHGFVFSKKHITSLCRTWCQAIKPYNTGIYASLSWLEDFIDWKSLVDEFDVPIWNAQYNSTDHFKGYIWQFTDKLVIDGHHWDGNILYDHVHKAGLSPFLSFNL